MNNIFVGSTEVAFASVPPKSEIKKALIPIKTMFLIKPECAISQRLVGGIIKIHSKTRNSLLLTYILSYY